MMTAVRILVADDHVAVRRGVRAFLETQPGWEICGEAVTGREAVEMAKQIKPDVVVMDLSMPELSGLEATRQILKALPKTEIVILTMHESEQVIREVLDAGARGYLLKSDAEDDMVAAVKSLLQHKPFFTSKVSGLVLDAYLHGSSVPNGEPLLEGPLSSREREILQLLAEGKSNKEVAVALGISVRTAEKHRNSIMHKLGFQSLSDLVRYALRNQIILP